MQNQENIIVRLSRKILDFSVTRPGAFFVCLAILLASDLLILRENAMIPSQDILDSIVPYFKTLFASIKQYGVVGWFPHWGPGMPVLSSQFHWWRPDTLLYFVFSPFWVYTVQYLIAATIGGYFMYLFLTRVEGLKAEVGILGGIFFTSIATRYVPDVTSIAALPLFLYCFDCLVTGFGSSRWKYLLGCLYYVLSVNLVYMQPYVVMIHFSLWLRFFILKRYRFTSFWPMILMWTFYGATQIPQVANMIFLEMKHMARAQARIPFEFSFSFFPFFREHHVLLLFLVVLGICAAFRKKSSWYYLGWLALALPFAIIWAAMADVMPIFGSVRCRVAEVLPFISAVLAAIGVDVLLVSGLLSRQKIRLLGILSLVIFAGVAWAESLDIVPGLIFAGLSIAALACVLLLHARNHTAQLPLLLLLAIALRFAYKPVQIIEFGPSSFNYSYNFSAFQKIKDLEKNSGELFRVVSFGIQPAAALYAGFQTADMYNPFYPGSFKKYWLDLTDVGEFRNEDFIEQMSTGPGVHVDLQLPHQYYQASSISNLPFRPQLLRLMNVKYLVSRIRIEDPERYDLEPILEESMPKCGSFESKWQALRCRVDQFLAHPRPRASLYRFKNYQTRVFFVRQARAYSSTESLHKALRLATFEDLKTSVYLEGKSFLPTDLKTDAHSEVERDEIESVQYSPDRIDVVLNLSKPGYLVMMEGFTQRWQCQEQKDSMPLTQLQAYGAFRAVFLPDPGNHVIHCEFVGVLDSMQARF